jgi:hypothetical protein
MNDLTDITGQRFGNWTVLHYVDNGWTPEEALNTAPVKGKRHGKVDTDETT